MTHAKPKKFEILLVEDNEADARLMKIAFHKCAVSANLNWVAHAEEAFWFLNNADKPALDLLLLDLSLPGMDGLEFLSQIRGHYRFSGLKVVALTGLKSAEDLRELIKLQIHGYLTKPADYDGFSQIAKDAEAFLLGEKQLPMEIEW